jgi:murein DD-endopeptidase MepM/ murein hydrolase activator NlpD
VPGEVVIAVEKTLGQHYDLRRLQPNHTYDIITSTDHIFKKFVYHTSAVQTYTVSVSSLGVYDCVEKTILTEWKEKRVTGTVTESMYKDLMKQGYDAVFVSNLVDEMADNILGWQIDFFTEQRPGDKFDVLLEQEYAVGSSTPIPRRLQRIIVASYTGHATRKKENIAIRYLEPDAKKPDYYDPEGNAVRKAFLRAPFTRGSFRISSRFNLHRFHPILRTYRPHHGTDYAASIGTPVSAIGKGTVVRAEWYKGYGRCVDIRHNGTYTSRYGHLSAIAVRAGQSVGQGQYIGRVGSSGLSTGPHLHFEMLVNGEQRNFLAMSFPAAAAVQDKNKADYFRVRDQTLAHFNGVSSSTSTVATAKR